MTTVTSVTAHDIRFPTSKALPGSDAMNPDPTTRPPTSCSTPTAASRPRLHVHDRARNELCVAAIEALAPVRGLTVDALADSGAFGAT